MKRILVALGAAAVLAAPAALLAQDKPGLVAASAVETVVTVREVDQQARTVTVEGEGGRLVTLKVPDEAQNLDRVYAGAKFKVRYLESVAIAVVASSDEPSVGQADAVEMAPKGDTPGGVITRVTQVTGSVEQIDYANRTVVVRG